jgi:hypothetical protein
MLAMGNLHYKGGYEKGLNNFITLLKQTTPGLQGI